MAEKQAAKMENEMIHDHDEMHAHGIAHDHGHTHSHEHTRAVVNRLARAIGHLERVKAMVEEGRDCSEVLIQLAAVRSAINNTGKVILKEHLATCIVEALESGNSDELDELNKAIERFL